jgi:hypothetical protein
MPFTTAPLTNAFHPPLALPLHLEHQPIFALPYFALDGNSAKRTDTHYISVGFAQWDNSDVSIKTMRHTGSKWSRQSEELPLHRVIDMTLFLAKAVFDEHAGQTLLKRGTMYQQTTADLIVDMEQLGQNAVSQYRSAINKEQPLLKDRLNSLLNVLNDLKSRGKI